MSTNSQLIDPVMELAALSEGLRRHDRYAAWGLGAEDFTDPTHRLVAQALAAALDAGQRVDIDSVALALQAAGRLDAVGGYRGLAGIAAGSAAMADPDRLRTMTRLRRIHADALEVAFLAERGDIHGALARMGDANEKALSAHVRTVKTAAQVAEVVISSWLDKGKSVRRVTPGIDRLEHILGCLPIGSMTLVGAEMNVGKSGFILEMLMQAALKNTGAGLVSVEDPEDVTGSRLIGMATGVSSRKFARGNFEHDDLNKAMHGMDTLSALGNRLLLDDCTGGTELDVCASMSQMAMLGARLIAVDYVQEIECSKRQQDRRNEVRWLGKKIKSHARRLGVALVMASQLSQPKDKATGGKPTKHQIKEGGDLGNSAEVILLLWRKEEDDLCPVNVDVAKCKWGGVGSTFQMKRDSGGRLCEYTGGGR